MSKLQEALDVLWNAIIEIHCIFFHRHEEVEAASVPLDQLRRQWLYDFHIADPEEFAVRLGLPSYSEEGAEHERLASDMRLARIEPLVQLLIEQGEWMATVMVHAGMQAQDISEETQEAALSNYRHLFVHNLMSMTATLVDLGVIHVDS